MSDEDTSNLFDFSNFRDLRFDLIPENGLDLYGDITGILFENQREKEFLGRLHIVERSYPKAYTTYNGRDIHFQHFATLSHNDIAISRVQLLPRNIYAFVSIEKSNRYIFISIDNGKSYIVSAYNPSEKLSSLSCTPATEMKKLFAAYVKVIPGKLERIFWNEPEQK